jgi:hypothetical protein
MILFWGFPWTELCRALRKRVVLFNSWIHLPKYIYWVKSMFYSLKLPSVSPANNCYRVSPSAYAQIIGSLRTSYMGFACSYVSRSLLLVIPIPWRHGQWNVVWRFTPEGYPRQKLFLSVWQKLEQSFIDFYLTFYWLIH